MLGPDLVVEQGAYFSFASRVVNTTDLMDIRDEMERFCPRATINRERYDSARPGDEIPDLYNAADADLRALSVNGWFDEGPFLLSGSRSVSTCPRNWRLRRAQQSRTRSLCGRGSAESHLLSCAWGVGRCRDRTCWTF
jgi:hypothetical protein